jgi:hypothetical protein
MFSEPGIQREPPDGCRAAALSGNDRDCASVDRPSRQGAAGRQLNAGWTELSGEQQNVNHLPIGLRAADVLAQQAPEIIKRLKLNVAPAHKSCNLSKGARVSA